MGGGVKKQASGGRRLTTFVGIKIDDELREAIQARVASEKIAARKHSRLYRALLRAGLEGDTFKTWGRALDELGALQQNLSRVGGNLNQVAYWLNAKDHLKDKEFLAAIEELRPAVKQCYAIVKELHHGLVRRTR